MLLKNFQNHIIINFHIKLFRKKVESKINLKNMNMFIKT